MAKKERQDGKNKSHAEQVADAAAFFDSIATRRATAKQVTGRRVIRTGGKRT